MKKEHFPKSSEALAFLFLAHYVRKELVGTPQGQSVESDAQYQKTIEQYEKFAELAETRPIVPPPPPRSLTELEKFLIALVIVLLIVVCVLLFVFR